MHSILGFCNETTRANYCGLCLTSSRALSEMPHGAACFFELAGMLTELEGLLESARRLIPQRDEGGIFLFCQDNRVKAGQFTYRNSFLVETGSGVNFQFNDYR